VRTRGHGRHRIPALGRAARGAARGYIEIEGRWRTNIFHLPVQGSGDGGIYSTAADIAALWDAFTGGRIVSPEWAAEMVRPRSDAPKHSMRYGLGFWLEPAAVRLEGGDEGVKFRSVHDPVTGVTQTLMSNGSAGAREVWHYLSSS
jgi:CubicO group peptidase (beta-lactamase class C family)